MYLKVMSNRLLLLVLVVLLSLQSVGRSIYNRRPSQGSISSASWSVAPPWLHFHIYWGHLSTTNPVSTLALPKEPVSVVVLVVFFPGIAINTDIIYVSI